MYNRCRPGRQNGNPGYYLNASALLKLNSTAYPRIAAELAAAKSAIPECMLRYFALSKAHEAKGEDALAIDDLDTFATRLASAFSPAWYRLSLLCARVHRRTMTQNPADSSTRGAML